MKLFEQKNITAEQLLGTVVNSSAPGSKELLPGDLLVAVKGMRTALTNMDPKQKLSSAKVMEVNEALSFVLFSHLFFIILVN